MGGAQTLKANRYQAKLRKELKINLFYSTKCTDGMYKHFLTKFLCTNKQKLFHYTIVPILTVDLDEQISSEGILLFPARSTSFAQLVEGNNSGFNKLICVHDLVS